MIESKIVGWCATGQFYDEYQGAGTSCPAEGCLDGVRQHSLRRRRMHVCSVCGWATAYKRAECDHTEAEGY